MAYDYTKLLAKLDRPPSGPNWVRFVQEDVPKTTKSIVSFVKSIPPFTYQSGYVAIRDRIQLGINLETAIRAATRSGAPAGRKQNEDLIRSFFEYDDLRAYRSHDFIEFDREWFRVSRDVSVPVSPLSVIREKGQFVPLFVCGWSEVKLTDFQRRLLVTIYEDAFLSLTDYQSSPAEFLFFPKTDDGFEVKRVAEVWQRGDYSLLSERELNGAVNVFSEARDAARQILLREMAEQAERQRREGTSAPAPRTRDLFD